MTKLTNRIRPNFTTLMQLENVRADARLLRKSWKLVFYLFGFQLCLLDVYTIKGILICIVPNSRHARKVPWSTDVWYANIRWGIQDFFKLKTAFQCAELRLFCSPIHLETRIGVILNQFLKCRGKKKVYGRKNFNENPYYTCLLHYHIWLIMRY